MLFTTLINIKRIRRYFLSIIILFIWVNATISANEYKDVFNLGQRFFNDSLFSLALEQYQKYLSMKRSYENDPIAYFRSAVCYYKMKNLSDAAEAFEEFVHLFPHEMNVTDAMFQAGIIRKSLQEFDLASDWFFLIWSRFNGSRLSQQSLFEAAVCAEKDKNIEKAIEWYQIYYDRFKNTIKAKKAGLSLVNLMLSSQEFLKTEEFLKIIKRRWKNDKKFSARMTYYQALLAKKMKRIERAEKLFALMTEFDGYDFPEKSDGYKEYIEILFNKKKYTHAHVLFKKLNSLLSTKPLSDRFDFYTLWAENSRRGRLYNDAIKMYKKLLSLYPEQCNVISIQYKLAECFYGINDIPNSIETLKKLENNTAANDYSTKAVLKQGEIYYTIGLYPSAIAAFRRYVQLIGTTEKDKMMFKIGKIYQEKYKRYGLAIREFENLLLLYPKSSYYVSSLFSIAQCQEKLKDYNDALKNYSYLSELGIEDSLILHTEKASQHIRNYLLKDTETAILKLSELLIMEPGSISKFERMFSVAMIQAKYLKNFIKALEIFQELNKISPNDSTNTTVKLTMAMIYNSLYEKSDYEKNSAMAKHYKNLAIQTYQSIISKKESSHFEDEAAFALMVLQSPTIQNFESFITKYPTSKYCPDIYFKIATYYEKLSAHTKTLALSKKAVKAYKNIVKLYPSSSQTSRALLGVIRSDIKLGKFESAQKLCAQFSNQYPHSSHESQLYYLKGILYSRLNKYDRAIEMFNTLLYKYSFSKYAENGQFELALLQQKTNRVFESLHNYQQYIQNYPDGTHITEVRFGIAKCLVYLGKNQEAVEIFTKLLDQKLSQELQGIIHFELANIALNKHKTYEALAHFKKALAIEAFSKKDTVFLLVGNIYFDNKLYAEAASYYNQVLVNTKTEADSVVMLTKYITSRLMCGKTMKLQRLMTKFKDKYGKKYSNNYAEIIFYEGTYLLIHKKYDKAINRYQYLLKKFSESDRIDDAAYQIALALYYQNKKDEALTLFQKHTIAYPASEFLPLSYFKIAMIFHGQNDFLRSAENFTKVISEKNVDTKTRFRAANNAAVAFQKVSSWNEAASMYTLILSDYGKQIHPSSFHLKAGFCLLQASNTQEAFVHFSKAVVNPKKEDIPEIHYWLATCHTKLGEYHKAIREYLKVPNLYSGSGKWGITSEFEAARVYEKLGEYNKAATLYKKIVQTDGEQGRFGKRAQAMIQRLTTLPGENK